MYCTREPRREDAHSDAEMDQGVLRMFQAGHLDHHHSGQATGQLIADLSGPTSARSANQFDMALLDPGNLEFRRSTMQREIKEVVGMFDSGILNTNIKGSLVRIQSYTCIRVRIEDKFAHRNEPI